MKWYVIFLMTFSSMTLNAVIVLNNREKKIRNISDIKNITSKIKKNDLIDKLRGFVKCCRPNRMVGTIGHQAAQKHLIDTLKIIDPHNLVWVDAFRPDLNHAIQVYRNDFKEEIEGKYQPADPIYKKWQAFTQQMVANVNKFKTIEGKNIIWEKLGKINPDEILILGANYDSIHINGKTLFIEPESAAPGADDNGTGVAALLQIIELLAQIDLPKTIRIAFFDFQEFNSLGSRAFVQKYKEEFKKKKVAGFANLLMLGHDTRSQDKDKKLGNMSLFIRRRTDNGHIPDLKLANRLRDLGESLGLGVHFNIVDNSFNSSDHVPFWQAGVPAMVFTQNWDSDFNLKNQHSANDFVETLNFKTYNRSVQYILGAVLGWAYDILPRKY